MKTNTLPIEVLKEYLFYDAKTGEFYWIKSPSRRIIAGTKAGCTNNRGYRCIKFHKEIFLAHRLAWVMAYGEWPTSGIDHINGVGAGDALINLRIATQQENLFNRKGVHKTSKYKGVHWDKARKKWRAEIRVGAKAKLLGRFNDEKAAAQAYVDFAKGYHGEYFHLPTALAMR